MTVSDLQTRYPSFSYDSFSYSLKDGFLEIRFQFSSSSEKLETIDTISGVTQEMLSHISVQELDQYVFQLGLAEVASYWKAFLSPTIEIRCGYLSSDQIQFWQKLLFHGLGEFFYLNQIDPMKPIFRIQSDAQPFTVHAAQITARSNGQSPVLVPVGGGKDSIVSLELLAKAGYPIYTCSGLKGSSPAVIDLFGKRHPRLGDIVFSRTLDPKLIELNAAGHPNGHTPFSSVLACYTVLIARLYKIPFIAISNEASSSEATGNWKGIDVNHQYSKSLEFETDFRSYVYHLFGDTVPSYFSLMRPLQELQIMRQFVTYPEYFGIFHSCNVGQKTNTWCGKCGKCAFVALLLSAFLDDMDISGIFGTDILNDESLAPLIEELIGLQEFKPFECVGTREESQAALALAFERRKGKELPKLLKHFALWVQPHQEQLLTTAKQLLQSYDDHNHVPTEFVSIVQSVL